MSVEDNQTDQTDVPRKDAPRRGSASVPSPSSSSSTGAENPKLLEMIAKLMAQHQSAASKVHSAGKPSKPMEEYKFWNNQPVTKPDEAESVVKQGPVEVKTLEDVHKSPANLPAGFEWCLVDIRDDKQIEELYDLLYDNYVEDVEEEFRFKYPTSFLRWAMTPPGFNLEFHFGVRAAESGKLLAFISGIPAKLVVREQPIDTVEINFLCVHKKLRAKRMAPVLIREVTRRVNLTDVWQALFTAGTYIPTPVATSRYYHRMFNWHKLYEVGFAVLPQGSSPAMEVAKCAVQPKVELSGFRQLREEDVVEVQALLMSYLSKFDLYQHFSVDEVRHWFLPRQNSPILSYVVESQDGRITEFVSAYGLESSVLNKDAKHSSVNVAYTFYYATTASAEELKPRLEKLMTALMVKIKQGGFDVLNAITVMDNPLFINGLQFRKGDGVLNYNLFNWMTPAISGGLDEESNVSAPGGIGVLLF